MSLARNLRCRVFFWQSKSQGELHGTGEITKCGGAPVFLGLRGVAAAAAAAAATAVAPAAAAGAAAIAVAAV